MKNEPSLLPLFPLEVVLFPGSTLPLHIFEPRYRKMVGDCLSNQTEFGVILIQGEQLAEVGCTARITEVVKKYDDGRMDILTEGKRRFEIIYRNNEEEVLRGEVTYFDDEGTEDPGEIKSLSEVVKAIYAKIVLAVSKPNTGLSLVNAEAPRLAFSIANHLGLPLDLCQKLLSLRSERERLSELHRYLEGIFPKIERLQAAQQKVGGNGHLT